MHRSAQQTLSENLRYLLKRNGWSEAELARRSGVSQKTVNNAVNMTKSTKIETAEALAKPFGLESWHLTLPDLPSDIESGGMMTSLIKSYLMSSDDSRLHIVAIAEREAKYKPR